MVNRIAGVHVYLGQCPITSPWQIGARAERFGAFAGPRLADFATYWAGYRAELEAAYAHFDALDVDALSLDELHDALKDAHAFHRRGWGVHFEVMYLLAANYVGFFQLAADLGLDTGQIAQWLAGEETSYLHTDAELWRLAGRARELDVAVALTEPTVEAVRAALDAAPQGATWWAEFEAFLAVWGQRTDETRDDGPAVVGRAPGHPAGVDPGVPHPARGPRLRRRPPGRARRAGPARRRGPRDPHQEGPGGLRPGPGLQPVRELRLVERGAQLPASTGASTCRCAG